MSFVNTPPPTVLYIGNFEPAHSTENHVAASFRALGWEVLAAQENLLINDPVGRAEFERALRTNPAIKLLLHTQTWEFDGSSAWIEAIYAEARERALPSATIHLDKFHGLARDGGDVIGRKSMFLAEHVFTADGEHEDEWAARGIRHYWLPPGVLAAESYDAVPDPARWGAFDVAFVGSAPTPGGGGNYHPEWPHRAELVASLRERYGDRFAHAGNGSETWPGMPALRGHDLNRFYATVPVIVGDSCGVHRDGRYWSDRFPETFGRGGFLVHPGVDELAVQVGYDYPGFEWDVGEWDVLFDTIDSFLAAPDARRSTRELIAARVRSTMTYTNRVQTLLDTIDATLDA